MINMEETKDNIEQKKYKKIHSITVRTVNNTIKGYFLLGVVAILIGLATNGVALSRQYIRHAFDQANKACISVTHAPQTDIVTYSKQIMEIYHSLSEEQKQKVGTDEYREYFSAVDMSTGSNYDYFVHMLAEYSESEEADDAYLGMYDEETNRLVYLADPDEDIPMDPGDWDELKEKETKKFLNWDGEGVLYDIDHSEKYGWMCTTGVPIRDKEGNICAFVLVDVTIKNVLKGIKGYAITTAIALVVLTLIISTLMAKYMRKTVAEPINAITDAAVAYADDKQAGVQNTDHFAKLEIHSRDELEKLKDVMANMEKDLSGYEDRIMKISAEKERISAELHMAMLIQKAALPSLFPPFPDRTEFDIYASMDPAREVGGDFYDFFMTDSDHLGLVIADVSGKGIPAALFMMVSKVIIQSCAMLGKNAAEVLDKTNEALCSNNKVEMFVTVWIGILEISTGKLSASNAGHEYPALKRADGDFELIKDKHGFVIGGMEESKYSEYEIMLKPGDKIFVYTDGVPEATDPMNNMFGTGRMLDALNKNPEAGTRELLENVSQGVKDFVKNAEQFDDLTMMCLEYRGTEGKPEK